MKKILSITAVLILTGYLVFSMMFMSGSHEDTRLCKGVEVVLKDSSDISLVDSEMILGYSTLKAWIRKGWRWHRSIQRPWRRCFHTIR